MAPSKRLLLPSLPSDLIEEVLYRLPIESLLRFKSISKKWRDLISDKRFMYNYSPERILRIENRDRVQIVDPVTGRILSDSPIPDAFGSTFYPITCMVHCDGILLCICYGQRDTANLALWNPVFRKVRWINPSFRYRDTDYFGIGYRKNTSRDYRILRFWGPLSRDVGKDPKCEIYDLDSGSWRVLDAKFDGQVDMDCKGVSIMGNMYWISAKEEKDIILKFDFTMETFIDICLCPTSWVTRTLASYNDRLSLLQCDKESTKIQVWLSNSLSDDTVSLTKYFEVTSPDLPPLRFDGYTARPGYSVGNNRNITVWSEGTVKDDDVWYGCIEFYEIDEGGIKKHFVTRRYGHKEYNDPFICSCWYTTSLIPVHSHPEE